MPSLQKQPDPDPPLPNKSLYKLILSRAEAQGLLDPGGKIVLVQALPLEKPIAEITIVVEG